LGFVLFSALFYFFSEFILINVVSKASDGLFFFCQTLGVSLAFGLEVDFVEIFFVEEFVVLVEGFYFVFCEK